MTAHRYSNRDGGSSLCDNPVVPSGLFFGDLQAVLSPVKEEILNTGPLVPNTGGPLHKGELIQHPTLILL